MSEYAKDRGPEGGMAPQSMSGARLPVRVEQRDPVNTRPLLWILNSRRIFRQVAREESLIDAQRATARKRESAPSRVELNSRGSQMPSSLRSAGLV